MATKALVAGRLFNGGQGLPIAGSDVVIRLQGTSTHQEIRVRTDKASKVEVGRKPLVPGIGLAAEHRCNRTDFGNFPQLLQHRPDMNHHREEQSWLGR
jgi:hypothetical protein